MIDHVSQITREAAHTIAAARVVHEYGSTGRAKIRKVFSLDEITCRIPYIYSFPDDVLQNYWIAYVERRDRRVLASSTVILVSKITGDIDYMGTAGDEG